MLHDLIETHRIVGVTQMKIEEVLIIQWFSIKWEYFSYFSYSWLRVSLGFLVMCVVGGLGDVCC